MGDGKVTQSGGGTEWEPGRLGSVNHGERGFDTFASDWGSRYYHVPVTLSASDNPKMASVSLPRLLVFFQYCIKMSSTFEVFSM